MCNNLPDTVQCCLTLKLIVATIRCRKYNTIDGRKYRSVDWFGREVSNSLRSCGLSETFVLHLIRLGKLTLEISALFTSDILTSVDS